MYSQELKEFLGTDVICAQGEIWIIIKPKGVKPHDIYIYINQTGAK